MKIGLVCPYDLSAPGGVREHVLALYQEFKKRNHQVKILSPKPKKTIANDNFIFLGHSIRFPSGTGSWGRVSLFLNGEKVKKILKRERFDLLHFHEPFVPFLSWQILNASPTVNVATFHSVWDEEESFLANFGFLIKPFVRMFEGKFSGLIAVSQAAVDSWQEMFARKMTIIPNGIDLKRFQPGEPQEKKLGEMTKILFVGRLEKRKGLIYLLRALKKIEKDNWRLIIVGGGPRSFVAKAFVVSSGLEKKVEFKDRVSDEELPEIYRQAEIACFPSIGGESFGIVLLEAMASGLSLVCFKNQGYYTVMKNYPLRECLVKPKDVGGLASALKLLINSKSLRKKLGQWGLKEVKKYSWEKVASRVLDYYQSVINY